MKIEINLKIFFLIFLLFIIDNINTYLIFLIFILIHELSHLIVGILIGGKPQKMTISIFGLSIEFYSYGKSKTISKLLFLLIGPLVNIFIGYWCNKYMTYSEEKTLIVYTNFALGFFNLLPILPLDGGKILKEILKVILGFEKSDKIVIFISKTILIFATLIYSVLIIKIKNIMILFLLIYLWYLYAVEEKKYVLYLKTKNAIKNIT